MKIVPDTGKVFGVMVEVERSPKWSLIHMFTGISQLT